MRLTGGDGTHTALERVGLKPALETAFGVVRAGGAVSRVGAPQYSDGVAARRSRRQDRARRFFDRTVDLDGVPDGYQAVDVYRGRSPPVEQFAVTE